MNKIKLKSRYGFKTYLIEREKDYLLETNSIIIRKDTTEDHSTIQFIDPSGGPMLNVGSFIEEVGKTIKHIEWIKGVGYVLTMK